MTDVSLRSNQCMSLDCCWLLVRHGETDWNIQNRFQGRENTQLNENGRAQMFAAGASLKQDVDSDRSVVVHTSSLARARESAEIIARGTRWQVRTSELFDEMDLGAWEGEPYDIVNDSPDWLELAPHGGETEKMFQRRIVSALDNIGRDTTQIFVLHGLVIQAILSHLFGRSLKFWHATPIVNAALARIAWNNDSCELVSLNEERK